MNSSIKILGAFQKLGLPDDSNSSLLNALEHFVVQLYCQNKIPSTVTNLPELRWYMFSERQTESTSSPPTTETLRQKVRPSQKSHIPQQDLPDPEDYSWKWSSSLSWYKVVTTLL